jgi:uncharacterized membrane protein YtjA (UPF0391 family)
MLRWTITFLIIAIIAAIFGFGGIAAGAATIAKILFFILLFYSFFHLLADVKQLTKAIIKRAKAHQ